MRLSPTAISRFKACPRKWRYSRDIRTPQKPSAALGERVEAVCNRYALGEGFKLDSKEARIVFPALKLIPTPVPQSALQAEWTCAGPPGVTYFGKMDMRLPPIVYDFKSTQSIDDWALNDDTFPDDTQRVMYADSLDDEIVTTRWIYMQTMRPYRAELVELTEPRARTHERRVELIDPLASIMVATATDPPTTFVRCLSHCSAYGGCPYKGQCYADQPPTLAEQIAGSAMGSPMLERLKKNAAAAASVNAAPTTNLDGPAEEALVPTTPRRTVDTPPEPTSAVRMPPLKRNPPRGNVQELVSGEIETDDPAPPAPVELSSFVKMLCDEAMDAADRGESMKAESLIVAAAVLRKRGAA